MKTAETADYSVLDVLAGVQERLAGAIRDLANQLSTTMAEAIADASSLQVSTFVSDDMENVTYEDGKFTGAARLRAITRINLDGDAVICVPTGEGGIDESLWKIHKEMVEQAQAHRAEVIKNLVSTATGMLALLKGS